MPCLAKNPFCKKSSTRKRDIFIGFLVLRPQECYRLSRAKLRKDLKRSVFGRIPITVVTLSVGGYLPTFGGCLFPPERRDVKWWHMKNFTYCWVLLLHCLHFCLKYSNTLTEKRNNRPHTSKWQGSYLFVKLGRLTVYRFALFIYIIAMFLCSVNTRTWCFFAL